MLSSIIEITVINTGQNIMLEFVDDAEHLPFPDAS
jgi:hypothetical protein